MQPRNVLGSTLVGLLLVLVLSVILTPQAESRGVFPASARTQAAGDPPLQMIEQMQGFASAVTTRGNQTFLGLGSRLVILDVTDPTQPTVTGQSEPLSGEVKAIAVAGVYAYAVTANGTLSILNIANPAAPVTVATHAAGGSASGVAVSGEYVYIAAGQDGLRVVHVDDPTQPSELAPYDTPGTVQGVTVQGSYAYLSEAISSLDGAFHVLSIANPGVPEAVGLYSMPDEALSAVVEGEYAYVAADRSGLYILDVGTPSAPDLITTYGGGDPSSYSARRMIYVAKSGNYLYIAEAPHAENQLSIVNVQDPSAPAKVGSIKMSARAVAAADGYAYAALGQPGMAVVDATNPAAPSVVSTYDMPSTADTIVVDGTHAYVSERGGGVHILDVSNPAAPVQLGYILTKGPVLDIVIEDDLAYIPELYGGLHIVDVSNPRQPTPVGFKPDLGNTRAAALAGNHLYLTTTTTTWVVDVSNPASPTKVFTDTENGGFAIAILSNYAYVTQGSDGIRILDISVPATPEEAGRLDTPHEAADLTIVGTYAYVADRRGGLRVLDLSTPSAPREVGFYDRGGSASAVSIANGYAFIAEEYIVNSYQPPIHGGVRVVNISSPTAPTEVGFNPTNGPTTDIAAVGGYVYLGEGPIGLTIYRAPDEPAPPIGTATPSATPTQPPLEFLGDYYGGPSYEVELRGQHAYLGVGARLDVLDVSDPRAPALVGKSERLPQEIIALALSGEYAFAAYAAQGGGSSGLAILDLSNPASPLQVGSFGPREGSYTVPFISDIAISGDYAYLGHRTSGIRVLDVSDPTNPVRRGVWSGGAAQVELVGNYLYTSGDEEGIHILDVSNPDSPTEVGSYAFSASDMKVVGQYAYLTSATYSLPSGLLILDVSDPTHPTQVALVEMRDEGMAVTVVGNVAYVAGQHWTLAFDVSDPTAPRELGYYEVGRYSYDVAANGSTVYVAAGEAGLRVLDMSNPETPTRIGSYEPPTNADAVDVVESRAYLTDPDSSLYYYSDANRLHIVDLANPSEPSVLARHTHVAYGWDVEVRENRAYFLGRSDTTQDGAYIFDISEPSQPQALGSLPTSYFPARIVARGDYAYVADRAYGLRIVDVSDPTAPHEVGTYRLPDYYTEALDVVVAGNYAYVAVAAWGYDTPTNNGLYVLDISDPSAPTRVGFLKTEGHKGDGQFRSSLVLVGNHVYLAENIRHENNNNQITYTSALRVIDVTDPTTPELTGSFETTPSFGDLAAAEGFVFVAERQVWNQQLQEYTYLGGVRVLDVRNPAAPRDVGFYDVREEADRYRIDSGVRDIVIEGNRVYVTSKMDALLVLTSRYLPGGGLTPTPTATSTRTLTPTRTTTATVSSTPSATPTGTRTVTPTGTQMVTPTGTRTITPTGTRTVTLTAAPSVTPTGTRTVAPSVTPTGTRTVAPTVSSTVTQMPTRTVTPGSTVSPSSSASPTVTATVTSGTGGERNLYLPLIQRAP